MYGAIGDRIGESESNFRKIVVLAATRTFKDEVKGGIVASKLWKEQFDVDTLVSRCIRLSDISYAGFTSEWELREFQRQIHRVRGVSYKAIEGRPDVDHGWGKRMAPPYLPMTEADGTNSEINKIAREMYVDSWYELINMSWGDLWDFCVRNYPRYHAAQIIYSFRVRGRIFRVKREKSGKRNLIWRNDLIEMKAAASEEKAGGKQSIPELSIGGLPAMVWPEEKKLDISWEDLELVRDHDRGY